MIRKIFFTIACIALTINLLSQQFSVMTYNIRCGQCDEQNTNNWEGRKGMLLNVIKKHNTDIIGFQEVMPMQLEYLKQNLPLYACFGMARDGNGKDEGCFIFYKKAVFTIDSTHSATNWLSSTPVVVGSNNLGDYFKRIVTFAKFTVKSSGNSFYHFNTHMPYIDSLQIRYTHTLVNIIKSRPTPEPFILTGDFNAHEQSPAIELLKSEFAGLPLVDTYRKLFPMGNISTFNCFTGCSDGHKIDYIFVDNQYFNTITAGCDSTIINGKYPSDHHSMNAVIELKK